MATATAQSKTTTPDAGFEFPSVEETTQRIRDLNERLIESSKSAGVVALDAYEETLQSLADFEQKVAKASQLDWVTAVAATHAKFISDLSTSYTTAVREQLK